MATLVDVSYFTSGPRQVRNASVAQMPQMDSVAVNGAIVGYVKALQDKYLAGLLGYDLGMRIVGYLGSGEPEQEEAENLHSGYEAVCGRIRESFADYVFFHILRDMNTYATITGLVQLKCADKYVSPIHKQVTTWNSMVERNRLFVCWASTDECPFHVITDKNLMTPINAFNL